MNILHISSSARFEASNSRAVGGYLIEQWSADGSANVVTRDLGKQPLPAISSEDLVGVHGNHESDRPSLKAHLNLSNTLIEELNAADTLVIETPIYNFGVPATLKQWIDLICRAQVTFKYTEQGPVGLTGIKTAYIIVASGGTPIGSDFDFASGYLKFICQFIGVEHIHIIDASGSKRTPEEVIEKGKDQINRILKTGEPA